MSLINPIKQEKAKTVIHLRECVTCKKYFRSEWKATVCEPCRATGRKATDKKIKDSKKKKYLDNRCEFIKKDGQQCKNNSMFGGYCGFHFQEVDNSGTG